MSDTYLSAQFMDRHIGPDSQDKADMLNSLGFSSLDELITAAMPQSIIDTQTIDLPPAASEYEATAKLREYANRNVELHSFYGQGFYSTITPSVIRRNILENPGWYTAYTPYQPEISQGRLEALLNFQTMIIEITGLPVANASLLDEASATAEAVGLMARAKRKGRRVIIDSRLHPQVLAVTAERSRTLGLEVVISDDIAGTKGDDLIGAVIAYPGTEGDLIDPAPIISDIHARGGLTVVVTDLLALQVLRSPGTLGADIAVGSSQRFGVPLYFGGPHAAFMSCTDSLKRLMPGRIVGVSKDAAGLSAYRLALQTREQHIRREKATSNICTAQALLAVAASMYAVWHGPKGLRAISHRVHALASDFAHSIDVAGGQLSSVDFFDTVTVICPNRAESIATALADQGYLVRVIGENKVSVAIGETATKRDVVQLLTAFNAPYQPAPARPYPPSLCREEPALRHPIFSSAHSETQLLRYMRRLQDKDLALDRTMIPLGSCTMKLNPTTAMEPISWPQFAHIHPFAPVRFTQGWLDLIAEIEEWLATITGYARVSIQPNAGSQGELAGLIAIRRYHLSRGDDARDIMLIPQSAHGTNAASATLAHMRVVVVETAPDGSIDLKDLEAKLEAHAGAIAGIMITYPSTHGVFEDTVRTVCEKVHGAGGQVYIDGANLNALAGIARPGHFGGDVSHLNLHKTFTIPHGGGGPGVGPVAVAEHLVPFLPTAAHRVDPAVPAAELAGIPISGTPYGSAGVLPISWTYIALMGAEGLKEATGMAILGANYIAHHVRDFFPILYSGEGGLIAHECIIDLRDITERTHVTATDVAKRLIDFGFHAPTLSFPVPGTLMIEPTESEDKSELDRFIAALRTIAEEISEIESGAVAYEDSLLRHAPFTARALMADGWEHSFSRQQAGFPAGPSTTKYFPASARLDEAWGDRNFSCACPPPAAFAEPQQ
ncbi:aminomethyl-transferring glycine dehydrogenase [Corynebacterium sp. ES2775-CONJ]|nr:aminomethyl-transferring glycine dehydrogenase [Corynebacterium sp. ES2775-CONJ]MCS4490781.1 aminomethyl-transferring glycine dehydrogenase [Corynebacterium sp. ES2775-CONJ]